MSSSPQYLRTDKAIMQALINLMREKPFEKITVRDILEETPVTRATFYAHYHDKYEIAERMLAHFFSLRETLRGKLIGAGSSQDRELTQRLLREHRELAQSLLHIRTEKVDFRAAIAQDLEQNYLDNSQSPTREIEAKIYAQAVTEMYITIITDHSIELSLEQLRNIYIPVAMKLLNLENDRETRTFLERKTNIY